MCSDSIPCCASLLLAKSPQSVQKQAAKCAPVQSKEVALGSHVAKITKAVSTKTSSSVRVSMASMGMFVSCALALALGMCDIQQANQDAAWTKAPVTVPEEYVSTATIITITGHKTNVSSNAAQSPS